jgi:hypothetical protein
VGVPDYANFTGTIDIDQPHYTMSTLSLSARCEWYVTLDPLTQTVWGPDRRFFSASVRVPAGMSPLHEEVVEVTCPCSSPGKTAVTDTAKVRVTIEPYGVCVLGTANMPMGMTPGDDGTYKVTVHNQGSEAMTFQLTATSGDDSLVVSTSQELFALSSGETATRDVRLDLERGAEDGSRFVRFKVFVVGVDGRRVVGADEAYTFTVGVDSELDDSPWAFFGTVGFIVALLVILLLMVRKLWRTRTPRAQG